MADRSDKQPKNTPGKFYNDGSCIDCDLCRETAPAFFRRDDDAGASYVWRQPLTSEELALACEAMEGCPTDSIGCDG